MTIHKLINQREWNFLRIWFLSLQRIWVSLNTFIFWVTRDYTLMTLYVSYISSHLEYTRPRLWIDILSILLTATRLKEYIIMTFQTLVGRKKILELCLLAMFLESFCLSDCSDVPWIFLVISSSYCIRFTLEQIMVWLSQSTVRQEY